MSGHNRLPGIKALVTGSSSGIGRATTESLLSHGATVVGIARDHAKFTPDVDRYEPVTLDLADLDTAAAALDDLARLHADTRVVISNAGAGRFAEIEQFSADQIRRAIDLNLTSHLLVARSFLPPMKRRGAGDVIIVGSEAALRGARKGSVYCAAKFGLRGASQALADECRNRGVRVTLINPGFVRTPFFDDLQIEPAEGPDNALLPEDIAATILKIIESPPDTVFGEINIDPPEPKLRSK